MIRHLGDKSHSAPTDARVKWFVSIARKSGPVHPASKAVFQRAVVRPEGGRRMQEFLRIARGQTA